MHLADNTHSPVHSQITLRQIIPPKRLAQSHSLKMLKLSFANFNSLSLLIKYLENYSKLDCNGLILCMYNREVSHWKAPPCNNPVLKNKCETRGNLCQFHAICFADF